jgi:phage terminase large subunit
MSQWAESKGYSLASRKKSVLRIETPTVFAPLLNPARYLAAYGGRGSGKSHFFAELAIERSIMAKTDIVCVREIQKSLEQSVKKLLEEKIAAMGVSSYFEIKQAAIHARNGGRIIFQGMQNHTADSIKSLEGYDVAWVEEAHNLSARSLELLRPTIRKTGSQIWFSWNPDLETDPVDALMRSDNPPPDSIIVKANCFDNPFLPDVLQVEMDYDRKRDQDKFAHIWLGDYRKNSQARVFANWRVDEFDAPAGTIFRLGADWGFSVDPTVLVRCYIEGRNLYVDYEAYSIGCEIDFLPDLFARVPESGKWPIVADSARPETIDYMQRHGYPKITHAIKGANSLEEGVEFLKSFDIIVHPRCQHVIDELALYSYKLDLLTGSVLPILEDKHNHTIDALRYACEGLRRAVKTPTVPRQIRPPVMGAGGWMR